MGIETVLKAKREEILRIAAKHGARNVRLFGSVARGEASPDSDVDFLVELEEGRSLFDLGGLLIDLQDLLGREVNVVTDKGLRARIRERVLKEAVALRRTAAAGWHGRLDRPWVGRAGILPAMDCRAIQTAHGLFEPRPTGLQAASGTPAAACLRK